MLKDIIKNLMKRDNVEISDVIKNSLVDGFVDIKAYKGDEIVYHDAGDNVVTDWMRQAILTLLTGDSYGKLGNTIASGTTPINTIDIANHTSGLINKDGYVLNGKQYFWNQDDFKGHYSITDSGSDNKFPMFPTKVLFGTGKEYSSWSEMRSDVANDFPDYYQKMIAEYGNGNETLAETNFNGAASGDSATLSHNINSYSSTLGRNVYSGTSNTIKTRTVADARIEKITSSATLSTEYGITGAIKTTYFNKTTDATKLDENKNLIPVYKGVGRPAFIYFNTPAKSETLIRTKSWADPLSAADVILTRDSSKRYLEKITFTVTLPEQASSNGESQGLYYPYNDFTLKQIGLFCDNRFSYTEQPAVSTDSFQYNNMSCGIMLAKKNITPFLKTAELRIVLSWVLSI